MSIDELTNMFAVHVLPVLTSSTAIVVYEVYAIVFVSLLAGALIAQHGVRRRLARQATLYDVEVRRLRRQLTDSDNAVAQLEEAGDRLAAKNRKLRLSMARSRSGLAVERDQSVNVAFVRNGSKGPAAVATPVALGSKVSSDLVKRIDESVVE